MMQCCLICLSDMRALQNVSWVWKRSFFPAPGGIDPALDGGGQFAAVFSPEVPVSDGWHLDVNIDPVHQRARNAGLILADLLGRAPAGLVRIAKMTAGA